MEMKTTLDILESLEADNSRLTKESILEANRHNDLLKQAFVAALDPYTVYYINKFRMPKCQLDEERTDDAVMHRFLNELLPMLSSRKITGNDAKTVVISHFEGMTERQQKWCQRILLKNLRCGVQVSTVNKIWSGLVRPFACALAEPLKTVMTESKDFKILEEITYPVLAEPKLDGLRCVSLKESGAVSMFTRGGTLLETLPSIKKELEELKDDNFALDSEAMSKDWNESDSIMMSTKTKKDDKNMALNIFDMMTIDEWKAQSCRTKFSDRSIALTELSKTFNDKSQLKRVESKEIKNEKELRSFYQECLDDGFEGIMIKDPDAVYNFKRSKALRKLKPVADWSGAIVGWYGGKANTKRAGSFGGFEVLLPNGVVTRVGGGLSDELRDVIDANNARDPNFYIGKIVDVEGQPPLTEDGKIRFPVFLRFRDESDADSSIMEAFNLFAKNLA